MALRRPISYQWRLFFPLVALLWAVIIVLALFNYQREKDILTQELNKELNFINSRIIDAYENNINMEPFMRFLSQHYEHSTLKGVRVSVIDDRGHLLYCIGTPISGHTEADLPKELLEATFNATATALHRVDRADSQSSTPYYFFGVRSSTDNKITVRTAMPYTGEINNFTAVDHSLWIIVVSLALGATLIAYISTRYLGKNIRLLHQFANNAASASDLTPVDFTTTDFPHDELGSISRQIVKLFSERHEAIAHSAREHQLALEATEEKVRVTKQLSNNINHELKTPVAVIKGYLDTMSEHPDMDDASRTRFLEKAREHVERLCSMLNDLASITRLEEGGKGITIEKIDLHDLLASVESELNSIKLPGGIKFSFDVPLLCNVRGNYSLLYGMIINLIRNADLHAHGTMCRLVTSGETARDYRFSFFDDGTGVAPEHLPHLFDRFYRIDAGRSRKVGGTGLGLPIVQNTIQLMGGTITVKNHTPHGLEFVFTLQKWSDNKHF